MHFLSYILKEWDVFKAWLETLAHIHQTTGALPPPPAQGSTTTVSSPVLLPAPGVVLPAGVTYVDATNGLFKIDAADAVYPGQLYCVRPDLASIPPGTQAWATGNWNSSSAKLADQGFGMWGRVDKMVPAKNADGSDGWTRAYPIQWIEHAWSIGAEFNTWDAAIAQAVAIATRMAKAAANAGGDGAGFSPKH